MHSAFPHRFSPSACTAGCILVRGTVRLTVRLTIRSVLPAILLAALLSGCGGTGGGRQNVLFHAISTAPFGSLDPAVERAGGTGVLHNVYETLTVYDNEDGQVKPCLAESWSSNATKTEWTFILRRDVLFHDGSPLTAAAVKKSIDRTIALGKGSSSIWDCVASLEAQNANTIIFRLNYAANVPLIASSGNAAYIISSAAASRNEAWFNEGHDAGSGPYRIAAATESSVSLEAFEGYRDGWQIGSFKKVFIEEVPSPERRSTYMQEGKADIVFFPDLQQAAVPGNVPDGYGLEMTGSWQSMVMLFNLEKDPCSSEDFRKALAYAFPYEETVGRILRGQAGRSSGMVPQGIWSHDETLPSYACDLEKARACLRRSGQEHPTITLSYQPASKGQDVMLELYRQNLESIGVNLILLRANRETQQKLAESPDPEDRQDIMLVSWNPDYADPGNIFKTLLADRGPRRGSGYSYLDDAELSLAIQLASILSQEDQQKAQEIYRNLQLKVFERCYLVFLYDSAISVAAKKDIAGLAMNPAYATSVYYYGLRRQ